MRRFLWLLGTLLLEGCAAYVPEPTAEIAEASATTLEDLREGRRIYINKCSGCHALFSVNAYRPAGWTREVDEMVRLKKAKLIPVDRERLLAYLTATSAP